MFTPTIPGPDPDTKTPKFKLPPLACDAHCHIFGPGAKYPYAPDRPYTPPDAPLEAFKALHAKLGVGRAVIVNASVHGTDNRVALDAIAASGGAYRAVANIDDGITERELHKLHDGGFRGCRFNFVRHLGGVPDMRVFDRVVQMIAPLGWHVDLHFDAIDLPQYAEMLARLSVQGEPVAMQLGFIARGKFDAYVHAAKRTDTGPLRSPGTAVQLKLMEALMDEVQVTTEETGTEVRLRRRIAKHGRPANGRV